MVLRDQSVLVAVLLEATVLGICDKIRTQLLVQHQGHVILYGLRAVRLVRLWSLSGRIAELLAIEEGPGLRLECSRATLPTPCLIFERIGGLLRRGLSRCLRRPRRAATGPAAAVVFYDGGFLLTGV